MTAALGTKRFEVTMEEAHFIHSLPHVLTDRGQIELPDWNHAIRQVQIRRGMTPGEHMGEVVLSITREPDPEPRCPSCGHVDDRGIVPQAFRSKGPFCWDAWHDGFR